MYRRSDCEIACRGFGKHRNGLQRFRCPECGKTYTDEHEKPLGSTRRSRWKERYFALKLLIEGSSIRTVDRITELHRDTICRLLVLAGERCEKILGRLIVNVPAKRLRDCLDVVDRDISLTAFYRTDIRPVKISQLGKFFLTETGLFARMMHIFGEYNSSWPGLRRQPLALAL